MIRLVLVEINRLRWRRAVQVLVPIALLVPLLLLAVWTFSTEAPDPDDKARAEAQALAEQKQPWVQEELERCLDPDHGYLPSDMAAEERRGACEEMVYPQPEWYLEYNQMNPRDALTGMAPATAAIAIGILALAAMTYAGADWSSGSISNQLLFNPRRGELFTAKTLAMGVCATIVSAATQALLWAGYSLVAMSRDLGWKADWTTDALVVAGKGVLLAAIVAMGCFALTMLVRHTVGALGIVLGVTVVSLLVIHGSGVDGLQPLSIGLNSLAIFNPDGVTYETYAWSSGDGRRLYTEHVIGPVQGFVFHGLLWGGVTALAAVAFRRRDVP